MILKFADDTTLEIITLFGATQYVQNANRDVLTIEIDPSVASVDEIKTIFTNSNKTREIRKIEIDESQNEIESIIGQHYTIYLSSGNERRLSNPTIGSVNEPEYIFVNYVKIAQVNYTELLLEQLLDKKE